MASSTRHTILLSVKSPIFAPLYLAKLRGGAFRTIDFKYAFELPASGKRKQKGHADDARIDDPGGHRRTIEEESADDQLSKAVLSKEAAASRYIAGVADPFRALRVDTDGSMYAPRIVAGLIRHQAFWLATHDESLKLMKGIDAARTCDYIICPPLYTSGFAALHSMLQMEEMVSAPDGLMVQYGDREKRLLPHIYYNTVAGYEQYYYRRFQARMGGKKLAYLTTDPSNHESPLIQFARKGNTAVRNTLMTALFAGNGALVRYPMLFDDIRRDLVNAMDALRNDPVGVAIELKDYSKVAEDRFMSFSNAAIPHARLVMILEDLLRDEVFSFDLTIQEQWLRRGARLRPNFTDLPDGLDADNPRRMFKDGRWDAIVNDFFGEGVVLRSKPGQAENEDEDADPPGAAPPQRPHRGDRERTEGLPAFARRAVQNYREFAAMQFGGGDADRSDAGGRSAFRWAAPAVALLLGIFAAAPTAQRALLALLADATGVDSLATSRTLLLLAVAVAWLVAISISYMVRDTRKRVSSWFYDLLMLAAVMAGLGVFLVDLMVDISAAIRPPDQGLQFGEVLGLASFCVSAAFVVFGTFVIATLDQAKEFWESFVVRWREHLIRWTRVRKAPLPRNRGPYSFEGKHLVYARYRPRWSDIFAIRALEYAGMTCRPDGIWEGTPGGAPPTVMSVGAGDGKDAAAFVEMGCRVVLVEPNRGLLALAREKFADAPPGRVVFVNLKGEDSRIGRRAGLRKGEVDLIVVAQTIHVFKPEFAEHKGAARAARRTWRRLLRNDAQPRLSIWYYNPDPAAPGTRRLHEVLVKHSPAYKQSGTQLLDAEYFKLRHFDPWIAPGTMRVSDLLDVDAVALGRSDVRPWLDSYSFRPRLPAQLDQLASALGEEWFDVYARNQVVTIDYKGVIVQGAIRDAPLWDALWPSANEAPTLAPTPLESAAEAATKPRTAGSPA